MLRELTLPELEVVSGGTDQSTVVSTGTRNSDPWVTSISAEEARRLFGDNGVIIGDPHGGLGVFGQMGGGSHTSPERHAYQDGQNSFDSEGNQCSTPGANFGHSWTAYNNTLGGDRSEQRALQAAYAVRDLRNASRGCSGMDGIVNPSIR